jgi:LEA14-like dessication related protein
MSFTACSFQPITFNNVENAKLGAVSQTGVEADITVRIKNPNHVSVTVYKSEMELSLNGVNVGKAYISQNVRIKGNSEEPYTFKIKADFSKLSLAELPKLISIALSKNAKIGLKGNLKGGKLFMKKSFPVCVTQSVSLGGM